MFSVVKNLYKVTYKNSNLGFVSSVFIGRSSSRVAESRPQTTENKTLRNTLCLELNSVTSFKYTLHSPLELRRYFSKKKGSKRVEEEESDSEAEEEYQEDLDDLGDNVITRSVPSIRLDSILKAGLGITKKKVEQEFYNFKLRINGRKVLKKSLYVHVGDELDRIRSFSPDTNKYLLIDRVIVKGVGSISGSGTYPVKMEVLKQLIIENYEEEPWDPSSLGELEK